MKKLTLFLLSFSNSLFSDIGCLHVSYCRLIQELTPSTKVVDLLPYNFNPHHFNPDINVTKKLTSIPELILPPTDFFIPSALIERKRLGTIGSKTFVFKPKNRGNTYSHFWFYPETYCSLLTEGEATLTAWGYKTETNLVQTKCAELKELIGKLKVEIALKSTWTFVIDHEILAPYFTEDNISVLNLHNVTEGGEFITPKQIKFLEDLKTQRKKTVWITTESFSVAGLDKYKKNSHTFEINLTTIDKKLLMSDALAYTKYLIEELKKL